MRRFGVVALVFLALSAGGSAAQVLPGRISWADARHGWIARGGYKCRPAAELCATENGGKSWHGIWLGFGGEIEQYGRTPAQAGLFVNRSGVWWTRDNRRRWFQTDLAPGTPWIARTDSIIGQSGVSLVRVRPWPPRGRARCPRRFVNGALPGVKSTFPRNVCVAVVNAGMRIQELARARADEGIGTVVPVPRGVAGLAFYCLCNVPTFEVFVWRPDRFAETDLSVPDGLVPGNLRIRVAWPDLFVVGQARRPIPDLGPILDVLWHSPDGGRSWTRTIRGRSCAPRYPQRTEIRERCRAHGAWVVGRASSGGFEVHAESARPLGGRK